MVSAEHQLFTSVADGHQRRGLGGLTRFVDQDLGVEPPASHDQLRIDAMYVYVEIIHLCMCKIYNYLYLIHLECIYIYILCDYTCVSLCHSLYISVDDCRCRYVFEKHLHG